MMNAHTIDTAAITRQSSVSVERAYAAATAAKALGTSTVAPKATYFRRSHEGHSARLSSLAPDNQKNRRVTGPGGFMREDLPHVPANARSIQGRHPPSPPAPPPRQVPSS